MNAPLAPLLAELLPAEAVAGAGLPVAVRADLGSDPVPHDLAPALLDACAVRIHRIGHLGPVPDPAAWGPLLALVGPGQELVWLVDTDARGGRPEVRLHLVLRACEPFLVDPLALERRQRRFAAVVQEWERHAFPDSRVERLDPRAIDALFDGSRNGAAARLVVGLPDAGGPQQGAGDPAPRSNAAQPNTPSLNDVLDACSDGAPLRLAFVVQRVDAATLESERTRWATLRDAVHPHVRRQRGTSGGQARSTSTTESTTTTDSESRQERDSLLGTVQRSLSYAWHGLRDDGTSEDARTRWETAAAQKSVSAARTGSRTSSQDANEGWSDSGEAIQTTLQHLCESFERLAASLYEARGVGGWRALTLVLGAPTDVDVAADALLGALAGPRSADLPLRSIPVTGSTNGLFRSNHPIVAAFAPAVPVLTRDAAVRMLLLPDGELPGVQLHRTAFGGRNTAPAACPDPVNALCLGHGGFPGAGDVRVPLDDLWRHVLIAGTTGSGKTLRALKLLEGLHLAGDRVRVLVLETAKRTYRDEFQRPGQPAPRVYTLGDATGRPLRINPFYFEPGTSLKRHLAVLAGALVELLPTEALVGPYLRSAVEQCYEARGWDIETGTCLAEGAPTWPSVLDFVEEVQRVADGLRYGPEVSANYRGALEGRARIFLDPTYRDLFSHDGNQSLDELFPHDAILEYEQLPPGELDVPAFLTSLLLERLRARQVVRTAAEGARAQGWVVLVEEAHNVLPRGLEGRGAAGEAAGGRTLVRNVERLLQEGRSLRIGVVVVDQSPARLARAVVQNTNTKILLRLEDGEEIRDLGRTLGLDDVRAAHIGLLHPGEAIIKAGFMANPVRSGPWRHDELPRGRTAPLFEGVRPPPSYLRLERLWRAVLRGEELPESGGGGGNPLRNASPRVAVGAAPGRGTPSVREALRAELEATSGNAPELAAYVLRAVALRESGGHPQARDDHFPGLPPTAQATFDALVAWAEAHARASSLPALLDALAPLERRLFLAAGRCTGGPTEAIPPAALALAARVLGRAAGVLPDFAHGPVTEASIARLRTETAQNPGGACVAIRAQVLRWRAACGVPVPAADRDLAGPWAHERSVPDTQATAALAAVRRTLATRA